MADVSDRGGRVEDGDESGDGGCVGCDPGQRLRRLQRLTAGDGERASRAQLFLIGALVIAVTLVVLALLLNAAIYTENIATRSTGDEADRALAYRADAVDSVGRLIDAENRENFDEDQLYGSVETDVNDGMDAIEERLARQYAVRGAVGSFESSPPSGNFTEGDYVRGDSFTNNESDDFTISGVDATRGFVLEIESVTEPNPEDSFRINVDGDQYLHVYDDGGNVTVAVSDDGTSPVDACTVNAGAGDVTFDATRGWLRSGDGVVDACEYAWGDGVAAPYDVTFENGSTAAGSFEMTVRPDGVLSIPLKFETQTNHGSADAVYAVEFAVESASGTADYSAAVRVAPGESP